MFRPLKLISVALRQSVGWPSCTHLQRSSLKFAAIRKYSKINNCDTIDRLDSVSDKNREKILEIKVEVGHSNGEITFIVIVVNYL